MSQDSYIFLKTEYFPTPAWSEILTIFCAEERERLGARAQWVIKPSVWLSVQEIGATHVKFGRYRWQIGVHYSSPYTVMKLWVTLAVPYSCLILLDGASYQGPESDRGPIIGDVSTFKVFAKQFLISRTSIQKVVKHGLLDKSDNLILDVAHNHALNTDGLGQRTFGASAKPAG